jgi:hypothetical protein
MNVVTNIPVHFEYPDGHVLVPYRGWESRSYRSGRQPEEACVVA